jgi:hypothetical protein
MSCVISHSTSYFTISMASLSVASVTQYLSDALDISKLMYLVYTDFLKGFDRIDHGFLLIKLESFGFSDSLVELIRSYLSDRFMYVRVNGYESKSFKEESGVPQGSVLGPLFFNIFINDLVDDLDVPHLLFADDMKIYLMIDSVDDALRLQGCIEEVSRRCKLNNLVLTHLKCSIVTFTRKTKPLLFDNKSTAPFYQEVSQLEIWVSSSTPNYPSASTFEPLRELPSGHWLLFCVLAGNSLMSRP